MPELKLQVTELEDCDIAEFIDTTGVYNPVFNPGGYGTQTYPSANVDKVTLQIFPPKYTVPIVVVFIVASNVISSGTISYNGAAAVALNPLPVLKFPFDVDSPLNLSAILLKVGDTFPDGKVRVKFKIEGPDGGSGRYTCEHIFDYLFDCDTTACNNRSFLDLDPRDCGSCEERNQKVMDAFGVDMFIRIAEYNAENNDFDNAEGIIEYANELCKTNCSTC